jgi:superfamily II DNA or RNA helicase
MKDLLVGHLDRTQLDAVEIDWPASPSDLRARRLPPKEPKGHWAYQREAVNKVVKEYKRADRGKLIMACGTGKTLTALFIREKLTAQRTLVLMPSLQLMKQTIGEWTRNKKVDFDFLPVCSDETVSKDDVDMPVSSTSDLGLPVTTDPGEIATFLRRRSGPRVVFATYQSSPEIAKAFKLGRVPAFDLAIADEAHRCAAAHSSEFATILDNEKIKARRRLFMTATPRIYSARVLTTAMEAGYEFASMDDEGKFGKVFHRLTFREAIERDLLTDYQVAIIGVDNATYRDWAEKAWFITVDGKEIRDARAVAGQIGLAKAMRRYDLRRVITFHRLIKGAKEFKATLPEVVDWIPTRQRPKGKLWTDYVDGTMSAGERQRRLQRLSDVGGGERAVISNARCLTEGIDVPTLDGVAFIDPKRSEIEIAQAVGRAIRLADGKTIGTIVIPVFINTDEPNPDVILDDSAFKPVWDVLLALRAHDEDLAQQLDDLRRMLGRLLHSNSRGSLRLPPKIKIDIPDVCGVEFARAFNVRIIEQTTASWEFWYGLLDRYVAENGTAQVNKDCKLDGRHLGGWCVNQRSRGKRGELSADQVERLDSLPGWVWDRHDSRWEAGFELLLEYVDENGHALIAAQDVFKGYPLGTWVAIQRRDGQSGKLSAERRDRLGAVQGWVWSLEEERWEKGFRHLQAYVNVHRNSRVTQTYTTEDRFRLGAWVNFQRSRYNQGKLEPDRVERLGQLPGCVWKASDAKWDEGFQHLQEFAKKHRHVRVPIGHEVDGFKLRIWYANQRAKFNKLSPERQHRLKGLPGWDDYSHDMKWETGFRHLLAYVKEHGDAKVERSYVVAGYPLGTWAMTQRMEFKKGRLAKDRVKRLAALPGWDWVRRGNRWEEGYDRLVEYLKRNGSPPPYSYVEEDDYRLGAWTHQQRHLSRIGELDPDRWGRMNKLKGWTWNPPRGAAAQRTTKVRVDKSAKVERRAGAAARKDLSLHRTRRA